MPFDPGFDDYISKDVATLYRNSTKNDSAAALLWGDGVRLRPGADADGRIAVHARGRDGFVDPAVLGGVSLLEYYFIDVGQGDGVLIKTPDFRHLVIDGGYPRESQPTRKSAADFIDWKFVKDYGSTTISLDAVLASHCDWDHTGGLADLMRLATTGEADDELDATGITVEAFYHAGIGWWKKPVASAPGTFNGRWLGKKDASGDFFVQLLGDRTSAVAGLATGTAEPLQGAWADLITAASNTKSAGGGPTDIALAARPRNAISERRDVFLPGFGAVAGEVAIHVLGPVLDTTAEGPGMDVIAGGDDKNTNGHSILLRFDYGSTRALLTGDLNKAAHQRLLKLYEGQNLAFQCDIGKACHHGSSDVSFAFMQAMSAAVTVISSGDSEGHDHPKPQVVGAAGLTGHQEIDKDEVVTPLVYSTELARSISPGDPFEVVSSTATIAGSAFEAAQIGYTERKPGGLNPATKHRKAGSTDIIAGLIYGLVNIRTDGKKILCATMNEGDGTFAVKSFNSRF